MPAPRQALAGLAGLNRSMDGEASSSAALEDDDDVQFCSRTGHTALINFPHAREHCVSNAFVPGKQREPCENCFCFVCDALASTCPHWPEHCMATHTQQQWQKRRDEWRRTAPPPAAAPAAARPPPHR